MPHYAQNFKGIHIIFFLNFSSKFWRNRFDSYSALTKIYTVSYKSSIIWDEGKYSNHYIPRRFPARPKLGNPYCSIINYWKTKYLLTTSKFVNFFGSKLKNPSFLNTQNHCDCSHPFFANALIEKCVASRGQAKVEGKNVKTKMYVFHFLILFFRKFSCFSSCSAHLRWSRPEWVGFCHMFSCNHLQTV